MDRKLIAELVRLRYKLMWAKTRSRNGKIALFLAGYLLLVMLLALMGLGGLGAGIAAVRQGRAEQVAQIVFGGLFMEAIIAPLMLGFGMNAVFSDYELRRYPVTAMDRRLARHFIGILDPFWAIFLILELGLVAGLYAFGGGSFWAGLLAVLLLIVSNYMLARVIGLAIDRLVNRKGGAGILMGLVILLAFVPGLAIPALKHNPGAGAALLKALAYTPPFGAAALTTGAPMRALGGLAVILWWLVGLAAVLVALEKRPPQRQTVETSKMQWETPYDRIARIFGPANAPLAAQWLRFCLRNNRFRVLYVLSLPLAGFITYQMGAKHPGPGLPLTMFTAALSCFPWITFIGTSRIAVNQYGYAGGAFRRYQLLPSDPAASLRVGSYVNLFFGSLMLPAGALLWILLSPPPLLISRLLMLLLMGVAGLFLLHAAGLWATVFGPRKGNYTASFGNDMSAFGNVVVIGGVLLFMAPPPILKELLPAALAPQNWWWTLLAAAVCIGIYLFSLKTVSALLVSRREHLMAIVEGRQS
jgi:hypothetical protein